MSQPQNIFSCGEYNSLIVNKKDNQAYSMASGSPVKIAGQPSKVVALWAGLHTQYIGDDSGNAYPFPDGTTVGKSIASNVFKVIGNPSGGDPIIIKNDGTAWMSGAIIIFPSGSTAIVDLWMTPNGPNYALDSSGNVYVSSGTGKWSKVLLPGPASAICANTYSAHFVLPNGQLYAYGLDYRYYGYALGQLSSIPTNPIRVDQLHKFPAPIAQITANYCSTIVILTDGSMWSWGENTQGTCGNGQETNMKVTNPTYSAPYYNTPQWNLPSSQGGALFVQLATQIGKGIQWAFLNRGCYNFYQEAEDANGNIYTWGRNKSGDCMNGIVGTPAQQQNQPNLWDVTIPTLVQPFGAVVVPPVNQAPLAAIARIQPLTLPANVITLDGSSSIDPDGKIVSYAWSQISGPLAVIMAAGANITQAILTTAGTYVFQLTVTDNAGAANSAQASVIVNPVPVCPPCPPIPAPRTVTDLKLNQFGISVDVPLQYAKFAFSDGGQQ